MLFARKAADRRQALVRAEVDRLTIAVTNGVVMAFDRDAREAWRREHTRTTGAAPQTVEGFKATLARLGAIPANLADRSGKGPGLVRIH